MPCTNLLLLFLVFYGPTSAIFVPFGGRRRDRNRGYISQNWDMLAGDGLRWRVLRNGVADSTLSVLLHAQLFYISSIYISARHGTDI